MDHIPGNLIASGDPMVLPDSLVALNADEIVVRSELTVEIRSLDFDKLILRETPGGRLDDRERFGKDFVEDLLDCVVLIFHQFVGFSRQRFLFRYRDVFFKFCLDLGNPFFKRSLDFGDPGAECGGTGTEFIIGKGVYRRVSRQDLVQDRLDQFHVFVGFGTEYLSDYVC